MKIEIIEYSDREKISQLDCMSVSDLAFRIAKKSNELGLEGFKIIQVVDSYNPITGYRNLAIELEKKI